MSQSTQPGWYADPHGLSAYRWWDGQSWTHHVNGGQAIAPTAPATQAGYYGGATLGRAALPSYPAQPTQYSPGAQPMGWRRNEYAFFTFGIVALYAIIALKAHIYILGILPVAMSLRSKARNEPLAIPAIIAAAVAVFVGVLAFTHR